MRKKNSLGRFFDNTLKKSGIGRLYRTVSNVHNLRLSTRLLIVVGLLTVSAATLYSAPPASKYMPGETLNPNCGPGDPNCSVEIGVGGGGSNWSVDGLSVYRTTGNVRIADDAYLNWGPTFGSGGYGFRDNGGVMEFKDAGGNWIALNSLAGGGGGGESLWTLHSNGQDIYRNGGNVGVNTTNPTAQFESTSAAIAAWFRGLMGEASEPWDFAAMVGSGRYELGSDDGFEACDVSGGAISPDGTKMFLAGHCFLTGGLGFDHDSDDRRLAFEPSSPNSLLSVHEYDLTTPWDVNSAVDTGRSYDPFIEADAHPRDVTFSPDGFSMYVINDDPDLQYNSNPPYGAVIHEYALSEAWTFEDGITHVGSKVLNSAHVDYAYNLEFNSDGTKVFLTGEYNDGSIWASVWGYELTDPYDITTLQEPAVTGGLLEEHIVGTFFGSSGDKFFVLVEMYPEEGYEILEIELDTPWNLDDLHTMDSERYVVDLSDLDNSEHLPTDLILKLDGSGFYTTFSSIDPFDWNGPMSGGISQYIGGGPQVQGGTVIVDGNVGIGTETPTAKLESVSSRIAGWFRGLTGAQPDAYDIDKAQHTYTLDIYEGCNGVVTRFTPDGLKMFLVSSCEDYWGAGDISYIDEFELTVPWDISTAAPGDYYEPDYYDDESGSTYGVLDVAFSDDGTSMFVLIDNWYGEQGEIYQYELSTPWSVGDVIDNDERATFPEVEFGSAYKMRFSDDGHRLFLMTFTPGLDMYDPPMAEMYEFELSTPWDITTVDSEERNSIIFTEQNSDVLSIPFGSFDFSEDGETLFVATQDEVWGGSGTTYNAAIRKYSLGIPWSLDDGPGFEKSYHIAPGFRDFSDLTFKSDGLGFYIVENPAGFSASAEKGGGGFSTQASEPAGEGDGGVHQFVITPETTGGTVLVEGNLGVGTLAPTSKLTVVGNSELQGDVRISGNVNLGDSVDLDVADGAFIISQTGEGVSLTGEGSRMVFIPHLSAFRAGEASYDSWNPVNIGRHSAAFGEYTIASGSNSSAFGRNTTASGGSSVAFGQSTIASGISSTAFGWNTEAGGYYSTALGYQSAAYGRSSVAMGYGTIARSFASVALGFYNHDDPSYDDYYSVQTDPIFVIGNGINQNYRSNAFTVLKNGNVGLSDSAYLNFGASDGVSIGETGYGFRDNNGVVEFRDREGGWIPLHSLGGGESGSLWVLNDAGDAIFNNGGRVGINTLDSDPGYQLEVASDSFAARFRASLTQWDKNNIQEDGHHEIQWDCYVASPNFNSNGTKMFAIRDWDCSPGGSGSAYIYEYDLSAPWDVTTAVQASSFYLNYYVPGKIIAATFNQDGKRMFLLSYNGDGDVSLNQFELGTAWKVDTLSYAKSTPIAVNSGTLSMATSLKLSRDGSSLYVLSLMDQSPLPAAGHIIQYSLREPWDISSLNEEANVNFSSADLPDISIAQLFDISSDGRRLFVGTLDITVADPSPYEVTIREYSLAEPWVISGAIEISDSVIESGSDSADATQFTGFVFRTDGRNAYTAQIASSSENARITQYEIGGGVISGGGVIVDGDLGVGTDSPLYKFHVSTTGTGSVAGFTNENGTCTIDPNTSSLSCSSDERLKTEVLSLGEQESEMSSLDKLMLLRPVSYRWNAEAGTNAKLRYGLIAQEVDDVFPELVTRGAYLDPEDISKGRTLSVSYGGFTPFFIDAIQELNTRIDTALLGLVIDGTVSEENLGGSLGDIITRALKNTVLTVKELVTGKVRTNELCIEDENGTTCIDRKDLDELLGNEKGARTENTNNPGNNPDNEGTSNTTNPEDDEDGKDEDGDETVTDPEAGQGGNQGDAGDTDPDEGAQGNGDEGAGQPDDATSGGSTSDDEEGE